MMSLPGNRTQQNTETRYPGFTAERSPQQVREQPGYFAVCPFPEARTRESSLAECVETQLVLPQDAPREASGPLPKNRKVTGELQPRPGPLSHPTWVTLSPFPLCVDRCFLGYLCLRQAPVDVAQKSVVWVCPHARGEQAGSMQRVQATQAAQEYPTLSGASPLYMVGTCAFTFLLAAKFRAGRSSRHTDQAQLQKLQAGLADGQCHFRASQSMWPMRWAPCSPPRVRRQITTTLPVRPSAVSM